MEGMRLGGKFPIHCSIYTQRDSRQGEKDTNTVGDITQSPMTQETMTELVECNTQLHKTLQGLWSDALTQHKLQQQSIHMLICPYLQKMQRLAFKMSLTSATCSQSLSVRENADQGSFFLMQPLQWIVVMGP